MEISWSLMWNDEISIFCMMYKMNLQNGNCQICQNFCILLYVKYEISIFFIMNDKYQNTYSVSREFVNYGNYKKKLKK